MKANKTMDLLELNELYLSVPKSRLDKQLPKKHVNEILNVWTRLKERDIHPSGKFDRSGRWYSEHDDCISCRVPSRTYPYSELTACRTLRYVVAIYAKHNLRYSRKNTISDLIKLV